MEPQQQTDHEAAVLAHLQAQTKALRGINVNLGILLGLVAVGVLLALVSAFS